MSLGEFRASRNRLIAELELLRLSVREMGIEETTTDLVLDRASRLISVANDCVNERELDRVRAQLGRLQNVVHEAVHRSASIGASTESRQAPESPG